MKRGFLEKKEVSPSRNFPLRVEVLRPLAIFINGNPLPPKAWDRQKTRSLFKVLLTAPGRVFSSEEIIDLIWNNLEPEEAEKSLRSSISKLRKVLEPDLRQGRLSSYILTERTGYAFNASPQVRLDTDDVTSFYRQGQEVRKQDLWEQAIDYYGKALSCFRGDFLADEPDTDWIVPLREHWKKVRQDLLVAKAESHLFLNQYPSAIESCREILASDPCHEEAYRKMMLCHYLSGHFNEVEIFFRKCVEVLKKELGVSPSEETIHLHEQILRRRVSGIDKTPRSSITVKKKSRVPYSLGRLSFVGRETEVELLVSHLNGALHQKGSIVAIGGEPGIGKTRLCEEILVYARGRSFLTAVGRCYAPPLRLSYEPFTEIFRQILKGPGREILFSQQPFWLTCAGKIIPELIPGHHVPILPPLPVEQEKHRFFEALTRLLIAVSAQTPLVLLLDDLHWVDDETLEVLTYLVRQISREKLLILATYRAEEISSNPLFLNFLTSIQRFSSRAILLSHLSNEAMADLFMKMKSRDQSLREMERMAQWIYEGTQGNPLFVVEFLQALLEKGILKVNARGKWISPEANQMERIEWKLPNGIRQIILSRLDRIEPDQRKTLGLLSTLSRLFTQDFLKKLLLPEKMESVMVLEELIRFGFIQEDPHLKGTYRFVHENIRQTISDSLTFSHKKAFHLRVAQTLESGASGDGIDQELAHHYLTAEVWYKAFHYLKEAARASLRSFAYRTALIFIQQAEELFILHGSTFADDEERYRQNLSLCKMKEKILDELGQIKKREKVVSDMIQLARRLGDPIEIGEAYLALANIRNATQQWEEGVDLVDQALDLFKKEKNREKTAIALRELGFIHWHSGQLNKALQANQEALTIHEEIGNRRGVAGDLHNLGQIYASIGNYDKGMEYYRQARREFQKIGDRNGEGRTLNILSRICRLTGNLSEAIDNTLEALEMHRQESDRLGEIHYLLDVSSLYLALGNTEEALKFYQSVLKITKEMGGSTCREGEALKGMGIIFEKRGDFGQASSCFSEAAALFSDGGDLSSWAEICKRLGDLMIRGVQDVDRALHYYETVLSYYRKEALFEPRRSLLCQIGQTLWIGKRSKEAIPYYREALGLAREKKDHVAEGAVLAALGVIYRETGRMEESLETSLGALKIAQSFQDQEAEGNIYSSLCETFLAFGRYQEAENSDEGKMYCEYEAPNIELIYEHARMAKIPADTVRMVAEMLPAMFQ
ncbi:MAG: tetratricopeptide repeat protein [Nitrospirae bacterium]|nr:tetratricopeptide repeat protein [Nitrospirota bacterium]